MTDRIGWGIIGCGRISRNRLIPAVLKSPRAYLAGVMSRSRSTTESTAAQFAAPFHTTDLDALLERKDVHAVYVASPVDAHREQVVKAAEAGKHVLCEKPMALTAEECVEMEAACRRANVKCQMAFMMRFHPLHQKVKSLIDTGELGELVQARAQLSHYHVEWNADGSRNWRQFFREGGGGSLMDMGIHCIDLIRWWMGEVHEVSAMTGTLANDYEVEDTGIVLLRMDGGRLASVDTTFAGRGTQHVFEVYGTRGAVLGANTISGLAEGTATFVQGDRRETIPYEPIDLFAAELEHFHDAILDDTEPTIVAADGRRSLEVCLAAYRSQREQRTIMLDT